MVSLHCEFTDKADVTETVTKTYSVPTTTSKALTEFHNGAEDSDQGDLHLVETIGQSIEC
jgi:hypothetical protein